MLTTFIKHTEEKATDLFFFFQNTHTPIMHAESTAGRISLCTYYIRHWNAEKGSYITTLHNHPCMN